MFHYFFVHCAIFYPLARLLADFQPDSVINLTNIIKQDATKLDPLPIPYFSYCLGTFLPYIKTVINSLHLFGSISDSSKSAIVRFL